MDVKRMTDASATITTPTGSTAALAVAPSAEALPDVSPVAGGGPSPRGPIPTTSQLIAVGPSTPLMRPDLNKLFSLYYHELPQTKPTEAKAAPDDSPQLLQVPRAGTVTSSATRLL